MGPVLNTADGPPEVASRLATLARVITREVRRACAARAIATAAIAVGSLAAALEVTARLVALPEIRALQAAGLVAGLAAAIADFWRDRPRRDAWRAIADGLAEERGLFSASAAAAGATRLSPLVLARADGAAAAILARPRPRRTLTPRSRQALLAIVIAAAMAALPGTREREDRLDPAVQLRLLADVRSLRRDASGAVTGTADRELLSRTTDDLERGRLSPAAARAAAERLAAVARERTSRYDAIASGLEKSALLRDLADAIRGRDPAAVERALRALVERARRIEPASAEGLRAAAALLDVASAEPDPDLRKALADTAAAFSGGSGSDASARIEWLAASLARSLRSADQIRDVVVTLDAAGGELQPGATVAARPAPGSGGAQPPEVGPDDGGVGPALPAPGDLHALARPGTSDEAVLRRYFALP